MQAENLTTEAVDDGYQVDETARHWNKDRAFAAGLLRMRRIAIRLAAGRRTS